MRFMGEPAKSFAEGLGEARALMRRTHGDPHEAIKRRYARLANEDVPLIQ